MKDKSNKQFCNSTDPPKKNELHTKIKTYPNSMAKLTCQGKEDYFKSYFENNKKFKRNMERHQEPHKHKNFPQNHNKLP